MDARGIYRQIGFLSAIVRLFRGESVADVVGGEEAQAKLREVFPGTPVSRRLEEGHPAGETPAFPGGGLAYRDVPGLCKAATLEDIEKQGWEVVPLRDVIAFNPRPAAGAAPIPFVPMTCLSSSSMLIDGIEIPDFSRGSGHAPRPPAPGRGQSRVGERKATGNARADRRRT